MKKRIFISSVQSEFASERRKLVEYIRKDALLGRFFDPFIFEEVPACSTSPQNVYLDEVQSSDLYIGLIGSSFGNLVDASRSATECEYDLACELDKPRLVFLKNVDTRDPAEDRFLRKIEVPVVRRAFTTYDELQLAVYAALVKFLGDSGYVRMTPFDMSFDTALTIADVDDAKIRDYLSRAREAGKITIPANADARWILSKLNALDDAERLSNAGVLLFAKNPQAALESSSVKCLQYWGNHVERPIPSYKTFEGGLLDLIENSLAFVMSRINREIGVPDERGVAAARDELPRLAVREAIVNAVCHRDYETSASAQVMLFGNRLEIINSGTLPRGWTADMLSRTHESHARNVVLAKALDWAGYVERSGHGTEYIIESCVSYGLPTPEYRPDSATFHLIIWRKGTKSAPSQGIKSADQSQGAVRAQSGHSQGAVGQKMILELIGGSALGRQAIAKGVGLSNKSGHLNRMLSTLLADGLIERTIPSKPNSRLQKYQLTAKARAILELVEE